MRPRILIAGIGNVFFGDDAFGVEAVRRLAARQWPDEVQVVDYGIRGLDLAYAIAGPYDAVILVDAVKRGGAAGSLYVIVPDVDGAGEPDQTTVEPHGMDPVKVLRLARALGGRLPSVRLIGCEPESLGPGMDWTTSLSQPVEAALDETVRLVESLVDEFLGRNPSQ